MKLLIRYHIYSILLVNIGARTIFFVL